MRDTQLGGTEESDTESSLLFVSHALFFHLAVERVRGMERSNTKLPLNFAPPLQKALVARLNLSESSQGRESKVHPSFYVGPTLGITHPMNFSFSLSLSDYSFTSSNSSIQDIMKNENSSMWRKLPCFRGVRLQKLCDFARC